MHQSAQLHQAQKAAATGAYPTLQCIASFARSSRGQRNLVSRAARSIMHSTLLPHSSLPSCSRAGCQQQHQQPAALQPAPLHSAHQRLDAGPAEWRACRPTQRRGPCVVRAVQAPVRETVSKPGQPEKVADVMTHRHVLTCRPETSIDDALEILVTHKITGMPVVDQAGKVVGVVSDYDMLSIDNITGRMEATGIFPTASMDWEAFHEVQKLILKNAGKVVADVMTPDPLVVRPETNIEAAARILLQRKVRRLPVVDDTGRLVGLFSRSDVVKAALSARKAAERLLQAAA